MKTRALDSSLWELLSHTLHYHAGVSTLCKVFSEAFTKPGYTLEDFLDHTYHTVGRNQNSIDCMDSYLCRSFLRPSFTEKSSESLH